MDIFGIGITEILFILLLAVIVLGPKDLQKYGKSLGEGLRKLIKSDTWRTVTQTSRKLKDIPTELMREAGVDEMRQELEQTIEPLGVKKARTAAGPAGARPRRSVGSPLSESWEVDPDEDANPVVPEDQTDPAKKKSSE